MYKLKMSSLFFEASDYGFLAAFVNSLDAPTTVKRLEFKDMGSNLGSLGDFVHELTRVGGDQHARAFCNFYPDTRFLKRVKLDDPKKGRDDPDYFPLLLKQEFDIDANEKMIAVINPSDGTPFGSTPLPTTVLFAGASRDEVASFQDAYVDAKLYPDRFEIGSIVTLGGAKHYLQHSGIEDPVALVDITSTEINLIIIKQNSIELTRSVDIGWNDIAEKCMASFDIEQQQDAKMKLLSGELDTEVLASEILPLISKEVQSITSFYELQEGGSIKYIMFPGVSDKLNWLKEGLKTALGLEQLPINYNSWLESMGIKLAVSTPVESLGERWFGLFSLMGNYNTDLTQTG